MYTLTFDKGLGTERSIQLSSFSERPIIPRFIGQYSTTVARASDVPSISNFNIQSGDSFQTVELKASNNVVIPLSKVGNNTVYNRIADFNVFYDDAEHKYGITIVLDKRST